MRQLSITPSITVTIGHHTRVDEGRHDSPSSRRWSSPGNAHRCRGNQHLLLPADPVLVGLNTLQHWLWQRLQAPTTNQVAA